MTDKIIHMNEATEEFVEIEHDVDEWESSVRTDALKGCDGVEEVVVEGMVSSIHPGAFRNCVTLKRVVVTSALITVEEGAFEGCSALEEVVFKDTGALSYFGPRAFRGCVNLRHVTACPTILGEQVFEGCRSLTEIQFLPSGYEADLPDGAFADSGVAGTFSLSHFRGIGDRAFENCTGLRELVGCGGVTRIGTRAFKGCSGLERCDDYWCFELGESAFAGCTALERIHIYGEGQYIPAKCFEGCGNLCDFHGPKMLRVIGRAAFRGCRRLTWVPRLYGNEGVIESEAFRDCGLRDLDLHHERVYRIGDRVFWGNRLTRVELPESIGRFGRDAFGNNPRLREIVLHAGHVPEGLAHAGIDKDVLLLVELPELVREEREGLDMDQVLGRVDDQARRFMSEFCGDWSGGLLFVRHSSMDPETGERHASVLGGRNVPAHLVLPEGVNEICAHAFEKCGSVRSISFPASLGAVRDSAYRACFNLERITFAGCEGGVAFGNTAFADCSRLKTVENLEFYEDWMGTGRDVFLNSPCASKPHLSKDGKRLLWYPRAAGHVVIPDGVEEICCRAFAECRDLRSVVIPEGVTAVGKYAFAGAAALAEVSLPSTLRRIEGSAFYGCRSLKAVWIPDGVEVVSGYAFAACSGLLKVSFPPTLKELGEVFGDPCEDHSEDLVSLSHVEFRGRTAFDSLESFGACPMLKNVPVLLADGKTLLAVPAAEGRVAIPDGVEVVRAAACSGAEGLRAVSFPASVRVIERHAFDSCGGLESVTFAEGLEEIAENAFAGCPRLEHVVLPRSARTIAPGAFPPSVRILFGH